MEVVIGVQFASRELRLDLDESSEGLRAIIDDAFSSDRKVLWLIDRDGKQIAVPTDKLAYIEVGADKEGRRVGFAAHSED